MSDLHRRIAGLSPEKRAILAKRLAQRRTATAPEIPRREDQGEHPLSYAQQRLWFMHQFDPDSPFYNVFAAVQIDGALDVAALEVSLGEVVRRHDVLRARIVATNGRPVQHIAPPAGFSLPVLDLRPLPAAERQSEALNLALQAARQPFDLAVGPLLRARLLQLGDENWHLHLAVHHIVFDGWSTKMLVREIAALYAAFTQGQPSPLPPLPIQYADFAHWQPDWLEQVVLPSELPFWEKHLGELPPLLELPTDRPRPAVQSYSGRHYSFNIPPSVYQGLKSLSQQQGATLFMTLLAAFKTLLYRYSGQTDFCVGVPIANRPQQELQELIGFFVNTVVMRTELEGDPSFLELLDRVRETTLAAFAHQNVPFEMLVSHLHPERDMSHTPLFQVMFDLQEEPLEALRLGEVSLRLLDVETGAAKFDLMLMMSEGRHGLHATLEYNTDLFDSATIQRMAGHFVTLLQGILATPHRSVATLPWLTAAEQRQILEDWNDTSVFYPADQTIPAAFEAQAERTPDHSAVVYETHWLTYEELNRRANQVAHALLHRGVAPGQVIGLCLERSVELIVALVGILKAGAAYLPLDPSYPADRLGAMLEDSRAPLLLTQQSLRSFLPDGKVPILCLDRDGALFEAESEQNPPHGARPDDPAYVIFTSGSTGRPKGVAISHRSALHLATALHQAIYAPHGEHPLRISLNAPLSFDASVQQLVMLLYGHSLYIVPQAVRADGKSLLDYIRRHRLDGFDCVPTQLKLLLSAGLFDGRGWAPSILMPGGEAIDEVTWEALARAEDCEIYNMYGPTECAVDSTLGRVRMTPDRPTIGRPVANARLYVLDAHLQPVPAGVPGELYIGGAGVGMGYVYQPELSAAKFVPDPFGSRLDITEGGRLYRTGDRVRYLPDGTVEFLGRIDHQVKLRGFRIELGEIEAHLREHPQVKDAVAIVRDDLPGEGRLVAYWIAQGENQLAPSNLRQYLKAYLPEYMLPAFYVRLDEFPLTPNAKVDRRALPPPDNTRPELDEPYAPPQTPLEMMLAELWGEVLGVERVGVKDDFFDLGGDSILAAVLSNRLQDRLDEAINVRVVFLAPTVAEMAAHLIAQHPGIEARRADARRAEPIAGLRGDARPPLGVGEILPVSRKGELPLSYAQQRLWFLDQLEPANPFYNLAAAVKVSGRLDVSALHRCLEEIVRRHEALRSAFHTENGKPRQEVLERVSLPLELVDLTDLPQEQRLGRALELATAESRRPFDLTQPPLLRATIYRLDEAAHVIALTMHHIVSDGWSMAVLVGEIAATYPAFAAGQPSPLEDLAVQYIDYANWQRGWLEGDALAAQLEYWRAQLDGLPPILELPTDRPRPAVQSFVGDLAWFKLSPDLTNQLKALSQETGVTLFMTLLAAFQTLLYRYAGQEDIVVGTPIANRGHSVLEKLVGFFVNTLVIRTDFSADPTFRELLQKVRETTLAAYAHQDLPFEMLVDALKPVRDLSHAPLFQVMFAFQNAPLTARQLPGLALEPLDISSGTAKFDLTLALQEREGELHGSLEYNSDLFDRATIERMMRYYQRLLEEIIADAGRPVSRLPLLTVSETRALLFEWNRNEDDWANQQCAHHIFERQASHTPDNEVVICGDRSLTYGQLNRRANQIAHHLQRTGIGPETLVGLCFDNSLEMLAPMLGVLKAGAAYLPLSPGLPEERLAFILEDTRTPLILSQSPWASRLPRGTPVILLDTDCRQIDMESEDNPHSEVGPDNLAYVIYTSGSTGKPKGVQLEHRGLCNLARAYIDGLSLGPGSRVLLFFSFSFDGSVADIFMSLLSGATLCLPPEEARLPGPDLARLIREQEISLMVMTPSALSVLPQGDYPALHTVISAGERCSLDVARRWGIGRRFFNAYGPTEATVAAAWYCATDLSTLAETVPIGRPLDNTRLYILDRHMQPVPVGVPGELYVGGVGVARGYMNRPELTSQRFVPDPYSPVSGKRLYRTGDRARYRPDKNIEYLGRLDRQVKVRGFRIEMEEIEAVLNEHPALREAAVNAVENPPGIFRLVAYLVPLQVPGPTSRELEAFLRQRLPEYMLPCLYQPVEFIPRTSGGKVDRHALPAPEFSRSTLQSEYQPPSTPEEEKMAGIWSQVLGIDQPGINDNFFELGGDSILAIQIISRAAQVGLKLSPRQLFQHPTIAGLVAVAERSSAGVAVSVVDQAPVSGSAILTPIQRWFFDQQFEGAHHWNQAFLLQVRRPVKREWLERALSILLTQHDALRLRFTPQNGGWQAGHAGLSKELPLIWEDLSRLPAEQQARSIEARCAELQAGLNLTQGPLLRMAYFDCGAQSSGRLLVAIHHLVVDGFSWRILLEDLHTCLASLADGATPVLPPKTTSYQAWAARLAQYAKSEQAGRDLPDWMKLITYLPPSMPKDLAGEENSEALADDVTVELDEHKTRTLLQDALQTYGNKVEEILLAALVEAIETWSGSRRLYVSLEGHGREDLFEEIDITRSVGWFTSLFPALFDLEYATGPGEALKAIKEQRRAIPHNGLTFGLLRYLSEDSNTSAPLRKLPVPQISFNYLGQFDQVMKGSEWFGLAPEDPGPQRNLQAHRPHQISLNGAVVGGRLQMTWSYSRAMYRRATINQIANRFIQALGELLDYCQSGSHTGYTTSDFPDVDLQPRELDALLEEIGETTGESE